MWCESIAVMKINCLFCYSTLKFSTSYERLYVGVNFCRAAVSPFTIMYASLFLRIAAKQTISVAFLLQISARVELSLLFNGRIPLFDSSTCWRDFSTVSVIFSLKLSLTAAYARERFQWSFGTLFPQKTHCDSSICWRDISRVSVLFSLWKLSLTAVILIGGLS